jgi:hypothetical protein
MSVMRLNESRKIQEENERNPQEELCQIKDRPKPPYYKADK